MSFVTYIYASVVLVIWSFVFGSIHFLPSKYCSTLLRMHHSLPKVYEKEYSNFNTSFYSAYLWFNYRSFCFPMKDNHSANSEKGLCKICVESTIFYYA